MYPSKTKSDKHMHELEFSEAMFGVSLIPYTPQEMGDMLKLCSHVRFKVPQQVKNFLDFKVELVFDFIFCCLICYYLFYI